MFLFGIIKVLLDFIAQHRMYFKLLDCILHKGKFYEYINFELSLLRV